MATYTWPGSADAWVLNLENFSQQNAFAASSSSGHLSLWALTPASSPISTTKAHESSINAISKIDESTLASASTDGIKVWDLRSGLSKAQLSLNSPKRANVLSLASNYGSTSAPNSTMLAAGNELVGVDAELHLWDLKNPAQAVRSYVDSHHDDITTLKFHPTKPYLMSGSTDGYVNIYNMDEPDEEEALHQTINYASVHSCHFTQENRISVLSHMETLSFWELNSTDYENDSEPRPRDLGDVRSVWPQCEYVVDIWPDYVAYGANSASSLTLMPFNASKEKFYPERAVELPSAHGEEVVRDVLRVGTSSFLTCGEDGQIKLWDAAFKKKEKKEKRKKDKRYKPY